MVFCKDGLAAIGAHIGVNHGDGVLLVSIVQLCSEEKEGSMFTNCSSFYRAARL